MKDLASRFSEVERRVSALVAENKELRTQVRELQRERDAVCADAKDAAKLRQKTELVRQRLQRLLKRLAALEETGVSENGSDRAREGTSGNGPG